MSLFLPLALTLLLAGPTHAACPASAGTLRQEVREGLSAYEEWEWERFQSRLKALQSDINCLAEVVPSDDARQVHLLFALAASRQKDAITATMAFRSVLALDPNYEPPISLASPGSPAREYFSAARQPGGGDPVDLGQGAWFVDGKVGAGTLPMDRSALVQLVGPPAGLQSWYVAGDVPRSLEKVLPPMIVVQKAPPPELASLSRRIPAPDGEPTPAKKDSHTSWALAGAGLGCAALSATGIYLAYGQQERFFEPIPDDEAEQAYQLNRIFGFGGYGVGGLGGALALGALIVWDW